MQMTRRCWMFGDNIDTDLMLPGYVMLLPFDEQPRYVFSANRPGWVDLVAEGDVLIAGRNFGTGSGRPASRSLKVVGIGCVVAESINGLFFRNCVNYGLPAMECPGVTDAFEEGDVAHIDFATFTVTNSRSGVVLQGKRYPDMILDTIKAGGIYPLMEAEGLLEEPDPETA
jgi:3-isopropylmalate/(R)-2-methylmalate dehydratase small subunit